MQPKPAPMTPAQYLEWEAAQPGKHEYVAGEVYAMTGASRRHNLICSNLLYHARSAANRRPGCQVFGSDMKLHILARSRFYYPDVSVCCDPADREEQYLTSPCLLAEVSSASTVATDRREKRLAYLSLESLSEYAIIAQDRMHVELLRRESGHWQGYILSRPEDLLQSACVDLGITLLQLYEQVEFPSSLGEPESEAQYAGLEQASPLIRQQAPQAKTTGPGDACLPGNSQS